MLSGAEDKMYQNWAGLYNDNSLSSCLPIFILLRVKPKAQIKATYLNTRCEDWDFRCEESEAYK